MNDLSIVLGILTDIFSAEERERAGKIKRQVFYIFILTGVAAAIIGVAVAIGYTTSQRMSNSDGSNVHFLSSITIVLFWVSVVLRTVRTVVLAQEIMFVNVQLAIEAVTVKHRHAILYALMAIVLLLMFARNYVVRFSSIDRIPIHLIDVFRSFRCLSGYSGAVCATPVCASNCVNGTCTAPNNCM